MRPSNPLALRCRVLWATGSGTVLALALALTAGAAQAGEPPARSRLCPEDLPEGVRLPPQPGCTGSPRTPPARRPGVYDLGDGTTLQIGGRASAAYGVRR